MNLEVIYQGEPALRLNRILVARQGLTDEAVEMLKVLHVRRLTIEDAMKTADANHLKKLANQWTENEFQLQDAWGFKRDKNFHRFWECPRCTCAKFDNEDAWPTGHYWITEDCPLHGIT